jgi:hypothetical protein
MALSDPIGEFEFSSRGLTVSDPSSSGGGSITVDYQGTATGYGTVASSMTFTVHEAGAKSGTVSANNVAWLENGDSMNGVSKGVFSSSGTNTWRVRAMVVVSDGTVLLSEGEVSLAEQTYKGKLYAWE